MEFLHQSLYEMQDLSYRDFHSKLMPTVAEESIIGIRTPALRKFAKEFAKREEKEEFLSSLPHKYYEENNLHAFIIQQEKDFDHVIKLTKEFLPYIDNWATCDMFRPKVFGNNPEKILPEILNWLSSDKPYTVRFGIGLLHSFFLDKNFSPEILKIVSKIRSDEYYVNMMIAWFFQTALVKQYSLALPYITENKLPKWVHNKTIRKASESFRITKEIKDYLKTFVIKD